MPNDWVVGLLLSVAGFALACWWIAWKYGRAVADRRNGLDRRKEDRGRDDGGEDRRVP